MRLFAPAALPEAGKDSRQLEQKPKALPMVGLLRRVIDCCLGHQPLPTQKVFRSTARTARVARCSRLVSPGRRRLVSAGSAVACSVRSSCLRSSAPPPHRVPRRAAPPAVAGLSKSHPRLGRALYLSALACCINPRAFNGITSGSPDSIHPSNRRSWPLPRLASPRLALPICTPRPSPAHLSSTALGPRQLVAPFLHPHLHLWKPLLSICPILFLPRRASSGAYPCHHLSSLVVPVLSIRRSLDRRDAVVHAPTAAGQAQHRQLHGLASPRPGCRAHQPHLLPHLPALPSRQQRIWRKTQRTLLWRKARRRIRPSVR